MSASNRLTPLADMLARLDGVRACGGGIARCPAHVSRRRAATDKPRKGSQ